MLTSDERILTTHAGSLPRPPALAELHGRRSRGEEIDEGELRALVARATADVIAAQVAAGIDIGNDGEQARESFVTYVRHRMTGFDGASRRPLMRDLLDHRDFLELAQPRFDRIKVNLMAAPAAVGDVTYRDTSEVQAECDLVAAAPFAQTFMTATSPGIVASAMENRYYPSDAGVRHGRRDGAAPSSTAASSMRGSCCRSTRPTSPSNATRCSPTARSVSSWTGWRWSSRPSTAR